MKFHARIRRAWVLLTLVLAPATALARGGSSVRFNAAYGTSVANRVAALVEEPWDRALDPLIAAFSSGRSSCLYSGEGGVGAPEAPRNFRDHLDENCTREFLWYLYRPLHDEATDTMAVSWIYAGFLDGSLIGYGPSSPPIITGTYFNCANRNGSLLGYDGATSPVTGDATGPATVSLSFDSTLRPWYLDGMREGSGWTQPYASVEDNALVITAVRQIRTAPGNQVLGVLGADFKIRSIEAMLAALVEDDEDYSVFIVQAEDGKLIATSTPGESVVNGGLVLATRCSNSLVAAVSGAVEAQPGSWAEAPRDLLTVDVHNRGLYWAAVYELEERHGLLWYVVVTEAVSCSRGFFAASPLMIANDLVGANGDVCMACPSGAYCEGGDKLPFPEPGFWLSRSSADTDHASFLVHECGRETCLGFVIRAKIMVQQGKFDSVEQVETRCWSRSRLYHKNTSINGHQNDTLCMDDNLMCSDGSTGPLCGACVKGFTFDNRVLGCVRCGSSASLLPVIVASSMFGIVAIVLTLKSLRFFSETSQAVAVLRIIFSWQRTVVGSVDRGQLKVLWSTYQVLVSVSWNLSVQYPPLFTGFLAVFAFTSFDLNLDCIWHRATYLDKVVLDSFVPIMFGAVSAAVFMIRVWFPCWVEVDDDKESVWNRIKRPTSRQSFFTTVMSQRAPNQHNCQTHTAKNELGFARVHRIGYQHLHVMLLLLYFYFPTVAQTQFFALDCIHLGDERSVLRQDTSIDCDSEKYNRFVVLDLVLIVLYQSLPFLGLTLLFRARISTSVPVSESAGDSATTSPPPPAGGIEGAAVKVRSSLVAWFSERTSQAAPEADPTENVLMWHLRFLHQDYRPDMFYFEIYYIWSRVIFVAVMPLAGDSSKLRAVCGCLLSIVMIAFTTESQPFKRSATNAILVVAQYQILLTYFAAFVIDTRALAELRLSDNSVGMSLVGINVFVVLLAARLMWLRWSSEKVLRRARKAFTDEELAIIKEVFGDSLKGNPLQEADARASAPLDLTPHAKVVSDLEMARTKPRSSAPEELELTNFPSTLPKVEAKRRIARAESELCATNRILSQVLIKDEDVDLLREVGSGSFGVVYEGTCLGNRVAVKTIRDVTKANLLAFRDEIILTSALHHPNIVGFVGACWGGNLICLILEWVPKGSLEGLLNGSNSTVAATWCDPLLKLAEDIARGMAYLHSRRYYDEWAGEFKECILHRDLKPDNVLVTDFLAAKITDFGTSRTRAERSAAQMTAVGTPLFCAPELARGEAYDEKVDVYSFGLCLLAMAVQGPLLNFISERWRAHTGKAKGAPNAMRFINQMTQHGWRPVTFVTFADAGVPATEAPMAAKKADGCAERRPLGYSPELPGAPWTVASLLVRCCSDAPADRPSFAAALAELGGVVATEVRRGNLDTDLPFGRSSAGQSLSMPGPPLSPTAAGGSPNGLPGSFEGSRQEAKPTLKQRLSWATDWGEFGAPPNSSGNWHLNRMSSAAR